VIVREQVSLLRRNRGSLGTPQVDEDLAESRLWGFDHCNSSRHRSGLVVYCSLVLLGNRNRRHVGGSRIV
jgi:hypothetical protein